MGFGGSAPAGGGLGLQGKAAGLRTHCLSLTDTRGSRGPAFRLLISGKQMRPRTCVSVTAQASSWDPRGEAGQRWERHREEIWGANWGGESFSASAEKKLLQEQVWLGKGAFPPRILTKNTWAWGRYPTI